METFFDAPSLKKKKKSPLSLSDTLEHIITGAQNQSR